MLLGLRASPNRTGFHPAAVPDLVRRLQWRSIRVEIGLFYDISNDREQKTDVSAKHSAETSRLRKALA